MDLTYFVYIVANAHNVLHHFSNFLGQQLIFSPYPLLRPDNLTDKMEDHYEDHVNGTDILSLLQKNNRICYQFENYEKKEHHSRLPRLSYTRYSAKGTKGKWIAANIWLCGR